MTAPTPPTHEAPAAKVPTDGPRSGIRIVRDGVAAYFEQYSVPALVLPVGLKYRSFQAQGPNGANRICFIPGEFEPGAAPKARKFGAISRHSRNAGSVVNPREIGSWEKPFTVSIWAGPIPGQNADEGQNLEEAENLLELLIRAVLSVGGVAGTLRFGEVMIPNPPNDNAFGAELLFRITHITPLFDITYETVQVTIKPTTTLT